MSPILSRMTILAQYWHATDAKIPPFFTHMSPAMLYTYTPLCWTARRNRQRQRPNSLRRLLNALRQIMETVNVRLVEQFHIEKDHF